jgi:glycosyltransferase involved in cell wall biosynthesis
MAKVKKTMNKQKLIRITTVPLSLDKLLFGQLNFMQKHYDVIAVSSEKDYLERIGFRENTRTFHLEMSRKITPVKDLIAVVKLFLFLKKEKPLIVHTHTPKAGIVGMLAARLAGVPNRFHTVAGMPLLEIKGFKRKILDFVETLTYACATKVYPNSFGLEAIILENNYCKSYKLKVLANGSSNGIDTAYFSNSLFTDEQNEKLKLLLNITNDDFVFIFVGRLVKDKGINEIVSAFLKLQKSNNKIKLLLVGDYESDLDPLLPETLNNIKINNSIISVGFQNDVRPYFAISNVLVFPSYREGFPNVVMQAGAMGLPSIVTNINGCNEIIVNRKNGLIIPVKKQQELFDAMNLVYSDIGLYNDLKSNARQRIVDFYEQKVVWQALLKEYK